jgi:hypothetical protein
MLRRAGTFICGRNCIRIFVQQRGAQHHVIDYLPKQPEDGSQNESWRTSGFNLPQGVRLGLLFGNLLTRLSIINGNAHDDDILGTFQEHSV